MEQLNIYEAKTHFSHWIDEILQHDASFIIAKAGQPVAQLTPLPKNRTRKFKFGALKGKIKLAHDFDAPLPSKLIRSFEKGTLE